LASGNGYLRIFVLVFIVIERSFLGRNNVFCRILSKMRSGVPAVLSWKHPKKR